jgi:regulator of sigma D
MSDLKDEKSRIWDSLEKSIEKWLHERQELIILLCAVDGLREFTPQDTPISIKVQAFCQVLIDYVSAGHFEIYDRLIKEAEYFGDNDAEGIMRRCYPVIQRSTDLAVQFNDTYETFQDQKLFRDALSKDMSQLAETLEERFQIEDELIELLHNRHKEMVA